MSSRRVGIIMHGITGRMGYNQHLVRSIVAIRDQGGVPLANGDRVMPDPILVGRNLEKVSSLAARHGIKRVAKDIDSALAAAEARHRGGQARLLREAAFRNTGGVALVGAPGIRQRCEEWSGAGQALSP